MTDRGWGRSFEDPIEADGRKLVTLRDAGEYIAALPKKDHDAPEWQARHGSIDAGCRARWPDDVRPDRHHEGLEPREAAARFWATTQESQSVQGYPMNRRVVRTALVSPVRHNPVTGTCLLMCISRNSI